MNRKQERFDNNGHINDMNIAIVSDLISAGRDSQIPEDIMTHCGDCPLCRDKIFDTLCSIQTPDEASIPVPRLFDIPEKRQRLPFTRLLLRSAAAFLVIASALSVYLMVNTDGAIRSVNSGLKNEKMKVNITAARSDKETDEGHGLRSRPVSAEKKVREKKIAFDPFMDNPNLEYMVDSPQRGRTIHVISPEFRIPEKGRIVFSWENHLDKDLHLKILNNRNETLFILKAANSRAEFSGEISPGLYYWKLEDNENLYHVGKFIIEK